MKWLLLSILIVSHAALSQGEENIAPPEGRVIILEEVVIVGDPQEEQVAPEEILKEAEAPEPCPSAEVSIDLPVESNPAPVAITEQDETKIAIELLKESQNPKHSPETKKYIENVADGFKPQRPLTRREKIKSFFKKVGRGMGRGSAWLTTATLKPFIATGAFFKGFAEDPGKGKTATAVYRFFMKYKSHFDDLYLEAGTPEEFGQLAMEEAQEILEQKSTVIIKDLMKSIGLNKEFKSISDLNLTPMELAQIDLSKLNVDLINNHPEYQDIRPLLGDVTNEQVKNLILSGRLDQTLDFNKFQEAIPHPAEAIAAVLGQAVVAPVTLSVISGVVGGLYTAPVLAADIGTGVSVYYCLKDSTRQRFNENADLKSFCSYVTNRSSYELAQVRAKGYLAGKTMRENIKKRREARKARRAARRARRNEA